MEAMTAPMSTPEVADPQIDDLVEEDLPWIVLVWNDPINLMSYVTFVLQKVFGYSKEKATSLMLDVHEKGRAVVSSGDRSAKIRTYNYSQGRVTDHRINLTLYNLQAIINGDLTEIIEKLQMAENAERLKESGM